jgi:peptidoglycan/LPS O-acetylase OafA/YrhL
MVGVAEHHDSSFEPESPVPHLGADDQYAHADVEDALLTVSKPSKVDFAEGASHIAHLNGLRAMAFIGVFLFHFRFGCQGGFLGVDVFFVLSGYLMTRSIANQISHGTYAYSSFLARRFWRLYPALLTTIIASMALTYCFFPSGYALSAAKSGLASVLGVSNFLFLSEDGYFGTAAAFKPLLHTWSLSVEWQFYLIWPVLMALGSRWAPNMRALWPLIAMCVASFVHSMHLARKNPMAAFFMLSPRAFEFGLGALASLPYLPRVMSPGIGNAMSIMGTSLILLSFQYINSTIGSPAIIALPSLVGAIMIILSPSDVFANRIFVSSLFDYIGKVSYSAYLVHWPAFVFYQNIYEIAPAPLLTAACVITSALVTSAAMFHTIEDKYRIPRSPHHVAVGRCLLVLAIVVSVHGIVSQGWNSRRTSRPVPVYASTFYTSQYDSLMNVKAHVLPGFNKPLSFGIVPALSSKRVETGDGFAAVVVGDSFCRPLAAVFNSIGSQDNKTFAMMSHSACASVFDKVSLDVKQIPMPLRHTTPCVANSRPEMLELIRAVNSKIVVLSSMWRWDMTKMPRKEKADDGTLPKSRLEETIEVLNNMGRQVIVMGEVPGSYFNVRACLAASGPLSRFKKCPERIRFKDPFMKHDVGARVMKGRAILREHILTTFQQPSMLRAQAEKKVILVDPFDTLCNEESGECMTSLNGEPYYHDTHHLTAHGAMLLKESVRNAFDQLAN